MDSSHSLICSDCGYTSDKMSLDDIPKFCPKCGGARKILQTMDHEDVMPKVIDEFTGIGTDSNGNTVSERIEKNDGNTKSGLAKDKESPTDFFVERIEREDKIAEEERAVSAFIDEYNKKRKTNYKILPKEKEDSKYADRVIQSEDVDLEGLYVQVRNLDDEMIADVGRKKMFIGTRSAEELIGLIDQAIQVKSSGVDPEVKQKTILVLTMPAPMGIQNHEESVSRKYDYRGFKGIWVCPYRDKPFSLSKDVEI